MFTALRRMLIPRPMVKVGMFFLADEAAPVISVLARKSVCQIEPVPAELEEVFNSYFPDNYRNAYRELRQSYEPLRQRWDMVGVGSTTLVEARVPLVQELQQLRASLGTITSQVDDVARRIRKLERRQSELEQFDEYLRVLAELSIDVRALSDLRFLHVRAGIVPLENVDRLRESAALSDNLVLRIGTYRDRAQVMVIGAGGISADLEGLLAKAHFEPFESSNFLPTNVPENIAPRLESEAKSIHDELTLLKTTEIQLRDSNWNLLLRIGQVLAHASVFISCEGALQGRLPVVFLSGWVPADGLVDLEQALAREVATPVALIHQPPTGAGEFQPPSSVVMPAIFRPGVELLSLYGLPGYDELNPTIVLAATTPLLFGMMFGDVGHGLLLAVAVLAARRWLRDWVWVGLSCSAGSIVFGLLYGSVFGVEGWLPSLWLRPMTEPFRLLAVALWIGVGFVTLAFVLRIMTLLRQGHRLDAVFDFQAAAGMVFYLGAVFASRAMYLGHSISPSTWVLVLLGIALMFIRVIEQLRLHGRSATADLASEFFHGLLTSLTNTLSFLRLAAFALAHEALSMAMYLLFEAFPPTVLGWAMRVIILIVGTALILVMDVLAVGVQTVRLQFYEGLARYYRGDGRAYRPLQFSRATIA